MKRAIIVLFSICFLFIGAYLIISSVSPKTDRDIIKYEGRIYSNITNLDWFDEEEKSSYQKGEIIGEIVRTSNSSFLLWNFSATKLQKGTVLYRTNDVEEGTPLIILADKENNEILFYRWLPEE